MAAGMRGLGRREETQDPLALGARDAQPVRTVSAGGVSNPGKSGGQDAVAAQATGLVNALGGVQSAVAGVMDQAKDKAITEGKIQFMQGKTLDEVRAAGNEYTEQGYQSLSAVDQANKWYTNEALNIQNTHYDKTPAEYAQYLNQARSQALANLPDDPAVRKIYSAAFEDMGPRLAAAQIKASSDYKERQSLNAFGNVLSSTASTAAGATRRPDSGPITQLRISQETIDRPVQSNATDRDIGIRTMLGEAGGEGEVGLAAVAHVLKNRQGDSRWGGTIAGVAKAPNQFSAWNSKARGGVDIVHTITPDSPMYQKAGLIYDAVMGGHTVDPTNGATHYYAPKGMPALVASGAAKSLVPGWAAGEAAKNETRIGNHIFVGKAGSGGSNVGPARFGLNVAGIVPGAQPAALPPDLSPTQAPSAPIVVGTAVNEHQNQLLEGSIDPKTDEDRAYLRANGGGTPGGVKNGVQVDVQPGADPNAVAKASGIDVTQPRYGTQVRELIMGYNGLRPEKKAAAIADQMRRGLAAGDDTLFHDAGGVSILRELNASPADIDEVIKAKKSFDKEQLNKFSGTYEKQRSQLLADAGSGNYSVDQIGARVQQFYRQGLINDSDAKALTRDAFDKVRTAKGDSAKLDLDLQDKVANIYTGVRNGVVTPHQAGDMFNELSTQHNIPKKELEGYVQHVYQEEQSRLARLESEARANAKTAQDQQVTKDLVNSALHNGYGLKNIKGSVKTTDPQTGNEIEISAQQWGVKQLEAQITGDLKARVQAGDMKPEEAGAALERIKFEALAKQGVKDEDFAAQFKGALSGNVIDPKTKRPSDGAKAAFDLYLRLGNNPKIGDAYVNQYLDDETKALVTTAKTMYDGRLAIEDALVKAYQLKTENGGVVPSGFTHDIGFNNAITSQVRNVVAKSVGTDSWMRYLAGSVEFTPEERDRMQAPGSALSQFIANKADGYKMQQPWITAEVAAKMAAADAPNSFIPTKGGMLYGNPERGERLDQAMGIEGYPKDTASKLIDDFVREHGPKEWGKLYTKRKPMNLGTVGAVAGRVLDNPVRTAVMGGDVASRNGATDTPAYDVQYVPDQKLVGITLLNNAKERQPRGQVMWVRADVLGAQFMQKERTPSAAANVWDTISRAAADTLYGNRADALPKQGYTPEEVAAARNGGEGFLSRRRRERGQSE